MTILPLDLAANATPETLHAFLAECREAARRAGRPRLVSISLEVGALDPLAVLESIFEPGEPHFYAERPDLETAVSGAEVALEFEARGAGRFAAVQAWVDETLAGALAVGDVNAPFGGPHFFAGFTFADETEPGEPFPAARVFVPRWQVARAGTVTTAVANLAVAPDADLAPLADRVWRAHGKFRAFNYAEAPRGTPAAAAERETAPPPFSISEAGDYRAAVARALERIAGGEFTKIVLARARDLAAGRPLHPLQLLNGLRQRFPGCYAFSLANGRGQSFIGASPERLVRVSRGVLETEALAGSVRRGASASEDAALAAALLGSEKDRREQGHVIEAIVSRLAELGLRPEFSAQPGVRRLANVQHLHTAIRATLPAEVRLLDAVAALHPTPAVGGSPQAAAVPCIRGLEGFPRGLYAGALGWLNARGGGEFFVGLRSALVTGARARLYAGAGLVAGSSPENEFAETELKFKAMQDALLAP
ncbi:MAG TPA: isochorismate synthase [Opitutaceae bacterium]|nr:isochorismate synthase [Opitutaceae bacterium]